MGVGEQVRKLLTYFFADNILMFCEPNKRALLNLRYVLLCFQAVSGPNINLSYN